MLEINSDDPQHFHIEQPPIPTSEPNTTIESPPVIDSHENVPKELGRIDIKERPLVFDVKAAQQLLPGTTHLKSSEGNEYILNNNRETLLLFSNPTPQGFTSVYSPLSSLELQRQLALLPEEQRQQLTQLLGLPENPHTSQISHIKTMPRKRFDASLFYKQENTHERKLPKETGNVPRIEKTINPSPPLENLPESHFIQLSREEYEARRRQQWESVKDLEDNDPKKIVYFRRFTEEYRSSVYFNPQLTKALENPYEYYVVDAAKMNELPIVEPYKPTIDIPKGSKIGMVIGYHHLEKPWGHLFREMMQQQAQYDPSQIEFIVIQNKDKPTSEDSPASEREIQEAVKAKGITHVIDLHEQLATLNHYMDSHENPQFREPHKSGAQGEYTLDPFVPPWMIEQYYQGHVYPQLQYVVNDQLKHVESLIKGIGEKPSKQ